MLRNKWRTFERNTGVLSSEYLFNIDEKVAKAFYDGLSLSRVNKLSIEEAVTKPHSVRRYMFRPILIYQINGEERALVGKEKIQESLVVLATNAISWNIISEEWFNSQCIKSFINKKSGQHDKILEDEIENILKTTDFKYCRNVKTFKQLSGKDNVNIDNEVAGEIDLIFVNHNNKTIYVADAKYNRARYEVVGYRMDYSLFINPGRSKSYEKKLDKKVKWVLQNIDVVQEHLCIIYNDLNINLDGYNVVGIFLINTPTFYMLNGNFKALTLNQFSNFLKDSRV